LRLIIIMNTDASIYKEASNLVDYENVNLVDKEYLRK
jgi:hypothetical protein